MTYLQNKYNIFCNLLQTLLHSRVKHRSFKMLQLFNNCLTKLSTQSFKKILSTLNRTYYFIYLFTALSTSTCTSHEFMTLRNCWTFGTSFIRVQLIMQLMDSTSSHLHTCSEHMRIDWVVVEAVKQCFKFVECIFQISEVQHSFVIKNVVEQLQHF